MEYLKNVSIEPLDNSKAIRVGFLILILGVILKLFFSIDIGFNPVSVLNFAIAGFYLFIFISTLILRFVIAAWAAKIANGLNRNSAFWALFTFIFPPLALIIIGFLDTKIENIDFKKVIDNCRADYLSEKIYINKELYLTNDELKIKLEETKQKYNKIIKDRLIESLVDMKIMNINNLIKDGFVDVNIDYKQQKQKIKDSIIKEDQLDTDENEDAFLDDPNKCPACGYRIDPELVICPDCGLTLR